MYLFVVVVVIVVFVVAVCCCVFFCFGGVCLFMKGILMRKILNIKYPVKITNSSLYEKCNECPLSITLLESRWRLFGHILRRNSEIPANKSMNSYFISHGSKFRGRPLTTLPVVLNKDLTRVSDDKLQLTSLKDLEHLRSVAQNRQTWRKLTTRIREAAEASPSDD